jgi:response regulator NasT
MALGIVMHRHSLNRHDALQRLQQQAAQAGTTLEAVSERLITAQEVLAGLGSIRALTSGPGPAAHPSR